MRKQPPKYNTTTNAPLLIPDAELIDRLADYGMPRKDAEALRRNPGLRLMATRFYFDVIAMKKGDKAAKERVDYCRDIWEQQRKRELERLAR